MTRIKLNGPNSEAIELNAIVDLTVDPKLVKSIVHYINVPLPGFAGDTERALTEQVIVTLKDKTSFNSPYSFKETVELLGNHLPMKANSK